MATFCGVTQKAISLLEKDPNREPKLATLKKLAELFEVDPDWLLTGKGPRNPVSSLTDAEAELLLLFRAISATAKLYVLDRVRIVHAGEFGSGVPRPKMIENEQPRLPAPTTKPN